MSAKPIYQAGTRRLLDLALVRGDSLAEFRVMTRADDLSRFLLVTGFQEASGYFFRAFPDSPDIPRIFENFSAHVEEMVLQKMRTIPTHWERALETTAERLTGRVEWWLSGSAALAVRGIDVRPRDIDLVVDDARRAGELLTDVLFEPSRRMHDWVAEWLGLAFDGALIEWVSGVHPEVDASGLHEQGPEAASRRELVTWGGYHILCTPLDIQLVAREARELADQVRKIHEFRAAS